MDMCFTIGLRQAMASATGEIPATPALPQIEEAAQRATEIKEGMEVELTSRVSCAGAFATGSAQINAVFVGGTSVQRQARMRLTVPAVGADVAAGRQAWAAASAADRLQSCRCSSRSGSAHTQTWLVSPDNSIP